MLSQHYTTSILLLNTAVRSRIIDELDEAMTDEKEEKIRENMLSNKPWSLKSWIETPPHDFMISITYDEAKLTSISISYKMNIESVFGDAQCCRVAARTWIAKECRGSLYPTLYHVMPGIDYALSLKCNWAWTSFNDDRRGMIRALREKKNHKTDNIRNFWRFWEALIHPVVINNTSQRLIICKLDPKLTVRNMMWPDW